MNTEAEESFLTQAEVDRLALPDDGESRYLTQDDIDGLIHGVTEDNDAPDEGVQSMKDWEEAIRETTRPVK